MSWGLTVSQGPVRVAATCRRRASPRRTRVGCGFFVSSRPSGTSAVDVDDERGGSIGRAIDQGAAVRQQRTSVCGHIAGEATPVAVDTSASTIEPGVCTGRPVRLNCLLKRAAARAKFSDHRVQGPTSTPRHFSPVRLAVGPVDTSGRASTDEAR